MPALRDRVMQSLYGTDVFQDFNIRQTAEIQGWNGDHPSLSKLSSTPEPKLIIDVGVWKGQSTINMAKSLQSSGVDGCVIGVDTFLGSPEHWDAPLFERHCGMPDLYTTFMSNVVKSGIQDYVVPMPQTSITAASILSRRNLKADIVHIDAAHEYDEVLRDANEYFDLLKPGGYLIGDDYHVSWPGVIKAASEFSTRKGLPLSIETIKWIVQKPRTVS